MKQLKKSSRTTTVRLHWSLVARQNWSLKLSGSCSYWLCSVLSTGCIPFIKPPRNSPQWNLNSQYNTLAERYTGLKTGKSVLSDRKSSVQKLIKLQHPLIAMNPYMCVKSTAKSWAHHEWHCKLFTFCQKNWLLGWNV